MQAISRRNSFRMASASALMLMAPKLVFAQWVPAIKIILEGLGALAAILGIADAFEKYSHDQRCDVALNDLETLKYQCEVVAVALDAEGIGAIPRLKNFLEKKDEQSWRRAKEALGLLLNSGTALVSAINAAVAKLNEKTYPGPHEDIDKLRQAFGKMRAAVAILASLPDKPEPETTKLVASILESMSGLPSLAQNAIKQLQVAVEDRRKLSC